jgi:hypothetical protein
MTFDAPTYHRCASARHQAPADAFFSFFFFCFSLVESFGLLLFLPFSIPLAMVETSFSAASRVDDRAPKREGFRGLGEPEGALAHAGR